MNVRDEHGFGLVELLIAMVMLNVGILALVAAFQAGSVALRRASHVSTAASLADTQMELYRGLTYGQIALDPVQLAAVDTTYKCDSVLGGACPNGTGAEVTATCGSSANACKPSRVVTGYGDKYRYRVDTYIVQDSPANARPLKRVVVVVRDGKSLSKTLAREVSTFDATVSG